MSKMASFLAGFGGGYLKAKDKAAEDERRAKEDEWRNEQRDRQRTEWKEADQLKQDMKDATAPRTTMEGTVTQTGDQKMFSADPAQAAQLQQMASAEAELRGEPAPTQTQGTAVTGNMSRGHQITTGPVDTAKLNDPTARNQRVVEALQKNGQFDRAMQMENALIEQKAKKLGLESAELKFADEQFNRRLNEVFSTAGDWTQNAANVMTDTKVGGLDGMTVTPKLSADGKAVTFVGTGKDGKAVEMGTFANSPEGRAQFLQQATRAPIETKIGWLHENAQREREAAKEAKMDDRWERTFALDKQKHESDMAYRNRMLQIQSAQEGRAAAVHRANMESAKIPPGVKMQAESLAKQIEGVNSALNKAMAEGQFDPNNPGTKQLLERQAVLGIQYTQLMNPFTPGQGATGNKAADPLGFASEQPAPAQQAPAAQQKARQSVTYDPALKTVVEAMTKPKPAPYTGPGSVAQAVQAGQQNRLITGKY